MGVDVSHDIDEIADGRRRSTSCACSASGCWRARTTCPRCASTRALWGVTPERVRPSQLVMHPGPINRGVEIARRGGRRRQLADRRPGAGRPGDADGGALRPAHRADHHRRPGCPARPSSRPGRRWPDAAADPARRAARQPADLAAPACSTGDSGLDGVQLDVRVVDGVDRRDRRRPRGRRGRDDRRRRADHDPGPDRPARAPAHPRRRGRGGHRLGHPRRRRRRFRGHPGDAQHRSRWSTARPC